MTADGVLCRPISPTGLIFFIPMAIARSASACIMGMLPAIKKKRGSVMMPTNFSDGAAACSPLTAPAPSASGPVQHERRERCRISYIAAAKLRSVSPSESSGRLKDISASGCRIIIDTAGRKKLAIDDEVTVSISIMRGKSQLSLSCPGRIVRTGTTEAAVAFAEPLCWWPLFSHFPVDDQFCFDIVRTIC